MNKAEQSIESLWQLLCKYVYDYEAVDNTDSLQEELTKLMYGEVSPQVEVDLEHILDVCAGNLSDSDYGEVLGSVNRIRKEVYGE